MHAGVVETAGSRSFRGGRLVANHHGRRVSKQFDGNAGFLILMAIHGNSNYSTRLNSAAQVGTAAIVGGQ